MNRNDDKGRDDIKYNSNNSNKSSDKNIRLNDDRNHNTRDNHGNDSGSSSSSSRNHGDSSGTFNPTRGRSTARDLVKTYSTHSAPAPAPAHPAVAVNQRHQAYTLGQLNVSGKDLVCDSNVAGSYATKPSSSSSYSEKDRDTARGDATVTSHNEGEGARGTQRNSREQHHSSFSSMAQSYTSNSMVHVPISAAPDASHNPSRILASVKDIEEGEEGEVPEKNVCRDVASTVLKAVVIPPLSPTPHPSAQKPSDESEKSIVSEVMDTAQAEAIVAVAAEVVEVEVKTRGMLTTPTKDSIAHIVQAELPERPLNLPTIDLLIDHVNRTEEAFEAMEMTSSNTMHVDHPLTPPPTSVLPSPAPLPRVILGALDNIMNIPSPSPQLIVNDETLTPVKQPEMAHSTTSHQSVVRLTLTTPTSNDNDNLTPTTRAEFVAPTVVATVPPVSNSETPTLPPALTLTPSIISKPPGGFVSRFSKTEKGEIVPLSEATASTCLSAEISTASANTIVQVTNHTTNITGGAGKKREFSVEKKCERRVIMNEGIIPKKQKRDAEAVKKSSEVIVQVDQKPNHSIAINAIRVLMRSHTTGAPAQASKVANRLTSLDTISGITSTQSPRTSGPSSSRLHSVVKTIDKPADAAGDNNSAHTVHVNRSNGITGNRQVVRNGKKNGR